MSTSSAPVSVPATNSARAQEMGYRVETTCAINVTDFRAASRWYQDVLGFTPMYELEEMGWGEFLTNVPGMTAGLSQVEPGSNDAPGPGGATLTFGVHDIEISRGLLEAKGVRFDGETREIPGMVKLATFFDPDGNTFMLAQGLQG
ncbi:MAG: VOC family protein [Dehalococcoidia bacterium]